jgi:Restriction endonuclease/XPA protein C-terminus
MPEQKEDCQKCGKKTLRRQPIVNIPICQNCWKEQIIKNEYKYITKTKAKSEFRLNEKEIANLAFFEVKNPIYATSHPMKLYLLEQIELLSNKKWHTTEPYLVELLKFTPDKVNWLIESPERFAKLTPEDLQYFVAERLDKMNFNVQLVGEINAKDGGIDIIATPRECSIPFLLGVQVKHHKSNLKVGQKDVRDLYGTISSANSYFNLGMIVTNTGFSPDAEWFAKQNKHLLRLRDLTDLQRWLKEDFNNEFDWREIPDEIELTNGIRIQVPKNKIIVEARQKLIMENIR